MRPWKKRLREPAPASDLPPLDVTVAHTAYGALVAIAGEVDVATVPRVSAALEAEPAASAGAIVVDLTGVTFIDSTGLGALVRLEHALAARAGRLAIACPEGPARLLFDVTGLAEQLSVCATRAEAEASIAA
jgi:anti-anti-sigma factor